MSGFVSFFSQILPALQALFILPVMAPSTFAGIYVFKNTNQSDILKLQNGTIVAMQQKLDALKDQNATQQVTIDRLEFEMKDMREALEDEGIFNTMNGKKITIKDAREPDTTRHIIRKPTKKPTIPVAKKPEEKAT